MFVCCGVFVEKRGCYLHAMAECDHEVREGRGQDCRGKDALLGPSFCLAVGGSKGCDEGGGDREGLDLGGEGDERGGGGVGGD